MLDASAIQDRNEKRSVGVRLSQVSLLFSYVCHAISVICGALNYWLSSNQFAATRSGFCSASPEPDTMRNAVAEDQRLQNWPPRSGCDIQLSEVVATYMAGTENRNALD